MKANTDYIPAKPLLYDSYYKTKLWYIDRYDKFSLYKDSGTTLTDMRIDDNKIPKLYISKEDKLESILEMQEVFNEKIEESISNGKTHDVKDSLVDIMTETLSEPRSGALQGVKKTVDVLVGGYSENPHFFATIAQISSNNYSTAIHSINVCAITLGVCFHLGKSDIEIKKIGLCAMLHDTGKIKVPDSILDSPNRLTDEEFKIIKKHPFQGYLILKKAKFDQETCEAAYQHHEKLNGHGYPRGLKADKIQETSQLLGIIDFYEAVTSEDRMYRTAEEPIDAFALIGKCVDEGELNKDYFEAMVKYLGESAAVFSK